MSEQKRCSELVGGSLDSRMEEITALWEAYCSGKEDVEDLGNIYEYGLAFDYVAPHSFRDQERGYFRYQISWGGPSEEFRFYCWEGFTLDKIEFWYLDWFDGAKKNLTGDYLATMKEIFEWFKEAGSVQSEYDKAMEDYEEPDDDDDDDDDDDVDDEDGEESDEEVDE